MSDVRPHFVSDKFSVFLVRFSQVPVYKTVFHFAKKGKLVGQRISEGKTYGAKSSGFLDVNN